MHSGLSLLERLKNFMLAVQPGEQIGEAFLALSAYLIR